MDKETTGILKIQGRIVGGVSGVTLFRVHKGSPLPYQLNLGRVHISERNFPFSAGCHFQDLLKREEKVPLEIEFTDKYGDEKHYENCHFDIAEMNSADVLLYFGTLEVYASDVSLFCTSKVLDTTNSLTNESQELVTADKALIISEKIRKETRESQMKEAKKIIYKEIKDRIRNGYKQAVFTETYSHRPYPSYVFDYLIDEDSEVRNELVSRGYSIHRSGMQNTLENDMHRRCVYITWKRDRRRDDI